MLIYTTIALLATLLPVLAGVHTPPPALRHRRLAESANHKARALINKPAEHVALEARANAAHADAHRAVKKAVKKRAQTCRAKTNAAIATSASSAPTAAAEAPSSTWSPTPSSTWAPAPSSAYSAAPASSSTVDNQQAWAQQVSKSPHTIKSESSKSSKQNNAPAASASSGGGGGGGISVNVGVSVNVGGLLQITNGACGWCGSSDSQPNGSEDWLNCGLNNGGWNPPYVACSDLVAVDLDASGVFSPCSQYIDLFNQFGNQYNVHPIMLASFAMQESTCNAGATGGNGEAGLMQIAPENCQAGNK